MAFFTNQVALITGAGSGLGRQLAIRLAREGAAIGAIDLHPEPLGSLETELAGTAFAWALGDVTDRNALGKAIKQVRQKVGPVDVLIANAGIGIENSGLRFRAEDFEAQIKVNLLGVANSIEAVLPEMLERKHGHLVGISSLASYRGLPKMAGYCASKAGLNALLDSLRLELAPHGIAVTTICPGWIRTPLTANIRVPQPYLLEVDEAARHIVEAVRRRRPFYAFPPPATRRVRLLRWLPCRLSDWALRRVLVSAADT
jgi:NAD(P)-dependent dehydrogenase (short-subunit alcohol dehydrogenase family)